MWSMSFAGSVVQPCVTHITKATFWIIFYPTSCPNIIIIIVIISSFYSLWSTGHPWRASVRCDLQLSPWPHSIPLFLILSSVVLCHVLCGLPLLYPWGFQSNAVFSVAPTSLCNVCPIQSHFLLFIWISIGFCLVILHSSSFVILSVHFIFIICLKHLFINICNLLVIWLVVLQVSRAYNNIDFTFVSCHSLL